MTILTFIMNYCNGLQQKDNDGEVEDVGEND